MSEFDPREHLKTFETVMMAIDATEMKRWSEEDIKHCLEWCSFASSHKPGLLAKSIRLRPLQKLYAIEESQEKVVQWLLSSPFLVERSSLSFLLNRLLSSSERETPLPRVLELLTSRRTRLFRVAKTKSIVEMFYVSRSRDVPITTNVYALTSARMIYAKLSELL
eukprot:TRINITY_DN15013_c0_g1_i1.p1 TRINITY_DN15013_c0_g1~~TRINITY_DN15013_c0_g1_i1.p1  ORF type:complete len:194 (+),score=48.58 TRINITY_DN15013_c0_g1_i1:88-582(+)